MLSDKTLLLRVLVGSRAHGLANENSDYDWRGVFVIPTQSILGLGAKPDQTTWIEGKEDNTSFEIGKFLFMATKCNPTILEMFKASDELFLDAVDTYDETWGQKIQAIFPHIWQPKQVADAFVGYGLNQRKKFLEDKDVRPAKYACAYLRTLFIAHQLLTTGTFSLDVSQTPIFDTLKGWRADEYTKGEVIDHCIFWEKQVRDALDAYPQNPNYNLDKVNDLLLAIRKEFWT